MDLVAFALSSLLFLFLIFIFILAEGLPLFLKVGVNNIIGGFKWAPTKGSFGIFPMIVSSFLVTIGALVIGAPMGLSCAIYLSEYSGKKHRCSSNPPLELLAGIPSVVYGFLGVIYIVPLVRNYLGGSGFSLLSTSIILGVMILPTIISISFDALTSVPKTYREGSFAMGATKWQTIYKVILPCRQIGHSGKLYSRNGQGNRRNHGGHHDSRQCPEDTRRASLILCGHSRATSPWSSPTPAATTGLASSRQAWSSWLSL